MPFAFPEADTHCLALLNIIIQILVYRYIFVFSETTPGSQLEVIGSAFAPVNMFAGYLYIETRGFIRIVITIGKDNEPKTVATCYKRCNGKNSPLVLYFSNSFTA